MAGRTRAHTALAAAALTVAATVAVAVALAGCDAAQEGSAQDPPAGAPSSAPSRASAPSGAPTARVAGRTRVLFFGDSYIVGGAYTGPEDSMGAIAARRLGWRYRIRGGGGTGFVAANPDYGLASYLGQIRQGALDVGAVDWLVVEGGGNDRDADPGLVTRRAVRTLRAAARRHPEARLVLVGTMDPTVDSFSDTDGVIGALGVAARQLGIPYVDAQRWLAGHPELVGPDYDHPTPAGHRLCGRKLASALQDLR